MSKNLTFVDRALAFKSMLEQCAVTDKVGTYQNLESGILALGHLLLDMRAAGRALYLIGNGGSAGVAAHSTTDFFNVAKLRATTLHESSLMTCMANDYGYENAFARMLSQMVQPGDVVIAISSSGKSMNIRNAAVVAEEKGASVVTLSGFAEANPLRSLGVLNFWLNSDDYGFVEIGHQFILHNVADRFGAGQLK